VVQTLAMHPLPSCSPRGCPWCWAATTRRCSAPHCWRNTGAPATSSG
jgi:hypothetical protein